MSTKGSYTSDEEVSMDSVSDYFDAVDTDATDKADASGEADGGGREIDASDGSTEMDSVPEFIDESETDVSEDEDITIKSDGDDEADADSAPDTEMDSVPDFDEEAESGANNDGGEEDVADEDQYDTESDEEDDYVSIEQLQQIAAVPVAEKTHSVNTLSNLCVGKILSEAMAAHQATTIDRDGNDDVLSIQRNLERLINKFSNPQFRVDLDNVYDAAEVVSDITAEWFPKYEPVINTLRKYAHVIALVVIRTPSTQVLATNYFSLNNPPTISPVTCFGYVLSLDNMWDIMVSLCFAIRNLMKQLQSTCDGLMYSTGEAEVAISKHLCAFDTKYLS
jgi:hypothetical protein